MQYVYVTPQCQKDAATISTQADIEALSTKLIYEQSTLGLQRHPRPFLKKRIGKTRVIIAEVESGEDVVLCFLRHVYKKDIGDDYNSFFRTLDIPRADDPELSAFLREARSTPVRVKEPPTDLEREYLILDRASEMGGLTILESPLWIDRVRLLKQSRGSQGLLTPIWELLHEVCDDRSEGWQARCVREHDRHGVRVLYRYFPQSERLFLVAPLEVSSQENASFVEKAEDLLERSEEFSDEQLLRSAARAYPDYILYDRGVWESTQASLEANLALSPEEGDVLAHVLQPDRDGGFPLFINGRPGSGKSTVLQYLFAEYLHAHLSRPQHNRLDRPPLYLTYNERLLDNARKLVEDIFHCGAIKLASGNKVNLDDRAQREEFEGAFVYFREFLRKLSGDERFKTTKYVDYHQFRDLYESNVSYGPDARLRKLAPEVAWHVLRTYIKGKNAGEADYFDPESYGELPRDEITVTPETYELVWDKVWNGWYRGYCEQNGFWDDQDLARFVLDEELAPSEYPAVFCDESQDFTSIELELIFRLSCYSCKRVEPYYLTKVPYAFAGDPFQTLNPTGFRWDAIKANFHDNIVRQLSPDAHGKVDFTFKELAYNYRSTENIVRFCNLVQLKRAELFGIKDVKPQQAWTLEKGGWPSYFELDLGTQSRLKEQSELVILVPCQEGEEHAFVSDDPFLSEFALDEKGEVSRGVLSPMRAKGLEFGRVVLYKFGTKAVAEGYVGLMRALEAGDSDYNNRELTLGLEYFFNGLYVAASRAQKRLLIVDTEDGFGEFWTFATTPDEIGSLLTEQRREEWSETSLHHMMRGDEDTWAEERDDPFSVAERFFEQGQLDKSEYLLSLARVAYQRLDNAERAESCTALIHDYKGEYSDAAASYERLGKLDDAIRCYWEARDFKKVSAIGAKDSGKFSATPFFVAARFMTGIASADNARRFLRSLTATNPSKRREQFQAGHWRGVVQAIVAAILNVDQSDSATRANSTSETFRILTRMRTEDGLDLENSAELAELAYRAGEPFSALEVWKLAKRRSSDKDPDYILRARAQTEPYPLNLKWYGGLSDHDAVVREIKSHPNVNLEREYHDIVLKAFSAHGDLSQAIPVLTSSASWSDLRRFLLDNPEVDLDDGSLMSLVGRLLEAGVKEGEFRQVIHDIKPGRSPVTIIGALIRNEDILIRCNAIFIKLLARSESLLKERQDDKFVSGTILNITKRHGAKLQQFVSAQEIGAALERAGRMDNALSFYEKIYQGRGWSTSAMSQADAKSRWLRCKQRQAELFEKDERKKMQRLTEAKHFSVEWGMSIPPEDYPHLTALTLYEIETLLKGAATTTEQLLADNTTDATAPSPGRIHDSDNSQTRMDSVVTMSLPDRREPIRSRVELAFSLDGIRFGILFLPSKRKLEIRDESNDDLILVKVERREVESDDLTVADTGTYRWIVEPFGLTITLTPVDQDRSLVDLSDKDGRRVVCLLV